MYVREKAARGHTYLYLVESEREGGHIRQRIIRALGRKDVLLASGELERLAASLVRHCNRAIILSVMEAGRIACIRIGGPLPFGGSGNDSALPKCWASCSRTAGLSLPSSAPSSPASLPDRLDRGAATASLLPGDSLAGRGDRPGR